MNITFFKRNLIDIYHFTQSLMFTMFYNPCLVSFSVASFYLLFFAFFSFSAKHFVTLFKKGLKCARDKSILIRHTSIINIYCTIMYKYIKTIVSKTLINVAWFVCILYMLYLIGIYIMKKE